MADESFDVVIVGGGSAGCVLANRLSEDPGTRVLVLEAGRPDWRFDVFLHMPAALTFPIGSPLYDWGYRSEPEPGLHGRRIYHARGKVLGGSSSINGMIFQRGNALDYERWAGEPGMADWDYAHCLPYFKRMETCLAAAPDDPYRGHAGPLVLERGPATSPLFGAFFEAVQEAGYALTEDVNGYRQEGFAAFDRNIHRGRRLSAATAYLKPALRRPNLEVRTSAFVTGITFDWPARDRGRVPGRGRAPPRPRGRGDPRRRCDQHAPAAPAVRGGGSGAPAGSGHRRRCSTCPAIGQNLQDHLEVYVQHVSREPVSMQPHATETWRRPWIGFRWLFFRNGPGATNHFEAGGFVRGDEDVAYPNLMFHFLPLAIRYDGSAPAGGHGYQVHVGPMYSDARGTVLIRSTDPDVHPALRFNYLSTDQDRREWVEAITVARQILGQPALQRYDAGEVSPGPAIETNEQILDWVGHDARDGAPSVVHGADGHRRRCRRRPRHDARPRHRRPARRRRIRVPVRHERQHLRARDDGGGEGRGPDPRQRPPAAGAGPLLSPPGGSLSPRLAR